MVTDFTVYILSNTCVCLFAYSFEAIIVHPAIRSSIISMLVLQNLLLGSTPMMKDIVLKISSKEALILCGNNKPFSLCLKPGTSQSLRGVMFWLHRLFGFEVGICHVTVLSSINSLLSLFLNNSFQFPSIIRVLHLPIKFNFKI